MNTRMPASWQVGVSLAAALIFWTGIFGLKLVNFWLGLGLATAVLLALALIWGGLPVSREDVSLKSTLAGFISAAILYFIFAAGGYISALIIPSGAAQIDSIYGIQHEANFWVIALLLLFLTSPSEEIFWRGFIQRWAMKHFGIFGGTALAVVCYSGVHLVSGSIVLTGAAFVAGLFWSLLYLKMRNIYLNIVSHAVFTVSVFLLFPL